MRAAFWISAPVRWLRGLWPDHNVLRRGSDRAEAAVVAASLIALLSVPLAASFAGRLAAADARSPHPTQSATYQVRATLTTAAAAHVLGRSPGALSFTALARWTAPDGVRRTGNVPVWLGAKAGSAVTIQVSTNGTPVTPAAQPWPASNIGLIQFLAACGTALLVLCVGGLARSLLDRRRMAAWDAEWRATGPRWSSRL